MPAHTTGSEDAVIRNANKDQDSVSDLIEIIERLDSVIEEQESRISDLQLQLDEVLSTINSIRDAL